MDTVNRMLLNDPLLNPIKPHRWTGKTSPEIKDLESHYEFYLDIFAIKDLTSLDATTAYKAMVEIENHRSIKARSESPHEAQALDFLYNQIKGIYEEETSTFDTEVKPSDYKDVITLEMIKLKNARILEEIGYTNQFETTIDLMLNNPNSPYFNYYNTTSSNRNLEELTLSDLGQIISRLESARQSAKSPYNTHLEVLINEMSVFKEILESGINRYMALTEA